MKGAIQETSICPSKAIFQSSPPCAVSVKAKPNSVISFLALWLPAGYDQQQVMVRDGRGGKRLFVSCNLCSLFLDRVCFPILWLPRPLRKKGRDFLKIRFSSFNLSDLGLVKSNFNWGALAWAPLEINSS